jgi:hypothetical protein
VAAVDCRHSDSGSLQANGQRALLLVVAEVDAQSKLWAMELSKQRRKGTRSSTVPLGTVEGNCARQSNNPYTFYGAVRQDGDNELALMKSCFRSSLQDKAAPVCTCHLKKCEEIRWATICSSRSGACIVEGKLAANRLDQASRYYLCSNKPDHPG